MPNQQNNLDSVEELVENIIQKIVDLSVPKDRHSLGCDQFLLEETLITELKDEVRQAITSYAKAIREEGVTENTNDGYHTFKELYEFRKVYNAILFNEWAKQDKYQVHKSKKHSDGEDCFGGGWFVVVATLPSGDISNHYELKDWDLFQCEEREIAKEWDGHTSQDVLNRLQALNKQ